MKKPSFLWLTFINTQLSIYIYIYITIFGDHFCQNYKGPEFFQAWEQPKEIFFGLKIKMKMLFIVQRMGIYHVKIKFCRKLNFGSPFFCGRHIIRPKFLFCFYNFFKNKSINKSHQQILCCLNNDHKSCWLALTF